MATGVIRKIHPIKQSRNGGSYTRIDFVLSDGAWAKTDIVKGYRNEGYWKEILNDPDKSVGVTLTGLRIRGDGEVNADSRFKVIEGAPIKVSTDYLAGQNNFDMKMKNKTQEAPKEITQCPMCLSINKNGAWNPIIVSFPAAHKELCNSCKDELTKSTGKEPTLTNIQCPTCKKRATIINGALHSTHSVGRTIKADTQIPCRQCR